MVEMPKKCVARLGFRNAYDHLHVRDGEVASLQLATNSRILSMSGVSQRRSRDHNGNPFARNKHPCLPSFRTSRFFELRARTRGKSNRATRQPCPATSDKSTPSA